jgi:hypothetical protein
MGSTTVNLLFSKECNIAVSSSADAFWSRSLSVRSIPNASASGSIAFYRSKRFLAISIDTNQPLNGAHWYLIPPKSIVKLEIAGTAPHLYPRSLTLGYLGCSSSTSWVTSFGNS